MFSLKFVVISFIFGALCLLGLMLDPTASAESGRVSHGPEAQGTPSQRVRVFTPENTARAAAQKTWDGGGATENWSDAGNWSDDVVPAAGDTVVFDGTSTKNATIDTNIAIGAIAINNGYTGTISQGASDVTLSGSFGTAFSQAAGTFNGGSGTTTVAGNFIQSAGTFNATTGTTTFTAGGVFERGAAATFNHNDGTVIFGGNSIDVRIVQGATQTQDFGNLTINTPGGLFNSENDTLRVNRTLNLNNGVLFSLVVEALGPVSIANTFGNGAEDPGAGKIVFSGSTVRTVTLPVLTGAYNTIELNAPNTTLNLSGGGEVKLNSLNLISGTFNAQTTNVRFHRAGVAGIRNRAACSTAARV